MRVAGTVKAPNPGAAPRTSRFTDGVGRRSRRGEASSSSPLPGGCPGRRVGGSSVPRVGSCRGSQRGVS